MKVTFEEEEYKLQTLKSMCEEFPDDSVYEITRKLNKVFDITGGSIFRIDVVKHYIELQKMKTSVTNYCFEPREPFSTNEMDYGTTDFNVTFDQLSEEEKQLYLESL